jgi:hypothetical protein
MTSVRSEEQLLCVGHTSECSELTQKVQRPRPDRGWRLGRYRSGDLAGTNDISGEVAVPADRNASRP